MRGNCGVRDRIMSCHIIWVYAVLFLKLAEGLLDRKYGMPPFDT